MGGSKCGRGAAETYIIEEWPTCSEGIEKLPEEWRSSREGPNAYRLPPKASIDETRAEQQSSTTERSALRGAEWQALHSVSQALHSILPPAELHAHSTPQAEKETGVSQGHLRQDTEDTEGTLRTLRRLRGH